MQHHHSPNRTVHRQFLIAVLALAFLAGACGNGDSPTAGIDPVAPPPATTDPDAAPTPPPTDGYVDPVAPPPTTDPDAASTPPPTAGPAPAPTPPPADDDGGWIGGEPVWETDYATEYVEADGGYEVADAATEAMAAAALAESEAMPAAPAAPPEADRAIEVAGNDGSTGLTGGSIDDNERFEEYLAYRERFGQLGVPVRDLDPSGRIVVTVTGGEGLPAAGVEVEVAGGSVEISLRTTADGTVRFHPEAYRADNGPFTVTVGGTSAEVERGGSVALETDLPTVGDDIALDILFLLDATGSMADEIDQLKSTIGEVVQRIGNSPAALDLRLGMTLYRDVGDTFVTANFNFTSDVDHFTRALEVVVADGGGDYAEALDEALADALGRPSWRPPEQTIQLVFLIADAPPQIARQVPTPYTESMLEAAERGIKIFPVSSSGTDDQAEFVFRQLAQFTGGRYVFLTYGAGGRATGEATDITERDYEELSLDDLIVRLVTEEIAALTGADTSATRELDQESRNTN